jgi:hypothetical protein
MTKNETKVEILRAVRKALVDRSQNYLCHAIAACGKTIDWAAAIELSRLVQDRLEGYYTLGSWLVARGYPVYTRRGELTPDAYEKLRRTRLAWIDSLIEEHTK